MSNKYELLTIFSMKESSDMGPHKDKVKDILSKTGFSLVSEELEMGRRILAYPINKEKEGFYWIPYIEATENADFKELNILLKRYTGILKTMLVTYDEEKIKRFKAKEDEFRRKKIEAICSVNVNPKMK